MTAELGSLVEDHGTIVVFEAFTDASRVLFGVDHRIARDLVELHGAEVFIEPWQVLLTEDLDT